MICLGCVGVHAVAGIWGYISAGLFAKNDTKAHGQYAGLFQV